MRAADASFPAAASPAHLDALTGIRGIAAWLVVLYHIRFSLLELLPIPVIKVLARGYLAVDLFFVLSGFVLWYNYAPRLRAGGAGAAGTFLWRRIARIWPLHLAVLSVLVAFALTLVVTGRDASFYPFSELPLHLLLIQNWGFTDHLTWNDPAWSISTEWMASLLFPLVVLAAKWERTPTPVLLAVAGILLAAIPLFFWGAGNTSLGADISHLGLGRCLFEFSLGNLLCLLWLRWRDQPLCPWLSLVACLGLLAAAYAWDLPETVFVPAAFVTGLMALATGRGPIVDVLSSRPLRYLGEVSYATYLAHTVLFLLFKLAFVDASLKLDWLRFGAFLALVLAASIFCYHGLEKPAQRWFNRHPPRWPLRANEVPAE
ncbi:acyltransferase family protein [Novosphingobium sp. JCM 18896]|uniref:acyltransferase family protein n=1 Tax=Novosphingobium sp. JCM 18896 TaxID=2989731 RepID=UPI002223D0AA|nr:acyltransferase [Novosphingobium sp. JCM 18896]MCW1431833.1 acyltransferase [Novosphingobium sp. JCM 18896]